MPGCSDFSGCWLYSQWLNEGQKKVISSAQLKGYVMGSPMMERERKGEGKKMIVKDYF